MSLRSLLILSMLSIGCGGKKQPPKPLCGHTLYHKIDGTKGIVVSHGAGLTLPLIDIGSGETKTYRKEAWTHTPPDSDREIKCQR